MVRSVRAYAIPAPGIIEVIHEWCPIHNSHMVREWADLQPEVHFLDWPSKGSDMNPIESLWGIIVSRLGHWPRED